MTLALSGRADNLPAHLTSFIERRHELAQVRALIGTSRLVTLTGGGGVGKTRLAIRVAGEVRRSFPDGVWFVDLSVVTDPSLVGETVAATLAVKLAGPSDAVAGLAQYFHAQRVLLVLDNCEHLIAEIAGLATQLLQQCDGLRILSTSREPLGIFGESLLHIPAMSVPEPKRASDIALTDYESVRLFLDRARAAYSQFQPSEENLRAVGEICYRLDGLPLAIELAAVRMRALSVAQVLERLSDPYRLLTGGSRTGPERQRTLWACIEWSYELCSSEEQRLWAQLSVFSGGWELDALEGVCGDPDDGDDVVDRLQSLVEKSIVVRVGDGSAVRYRMLDIIREFGAQKLESAAEKLALAQRHSSWYQALLTRCEADWLGPRQADWLARMQREVANLQAALDHTLGPADDPQAALALLVPAWRVCWWATGRTDELRRWIDRALARHPAPSPLREQAVVIRGYLNSLQGRDDIAAADFVAAVEQARAAGDRATVILAAVARAILAAHRGDQSTAAECFADGYASLEASRGTDAYLSLFALVIAESAAGGGSTVTREQIESVLAALRQRGELFEQSFVLVGAGTHAWVDGDLDRAIELLSEGLRLKRDVGNATGAAITVQVLASVLSSKGECAPAARLLGAADALWRYAGAKRALFSRYQRYADEARASVIAALGPAAFERAYAAGIGMDVAAAIATALNESPATGPGGAGGAASPLTRREREIAELVAQGLSNKQVAAALVIATRTAEGHVEKVLGKLGLASRSQIVGWIARNP